VRRAVEWAAKAVRLGVSMRWTVRMLGHSFHNEVQISAKVMQCQSVSIIPGRVAGNCRESRLDAFNEK
jgi:hypothetical protein